jgi:hypothetical protein
MTTADSADAVARAHHPSTLPTRREGAHLAPAPEPPAIRRRRGPAPPFDPLSADEIADNEDWLSG